VPRGGKRIGAGRKVGALTKRTREAAERATATGMTPLDYMLEVMRNDGNDVDTRLDAAKSAAPYVHPRLSSVDHKSTDGSMTPKPDHIIIEAAVDDGEDQATAETRPSLQ